MATTVRPWPTQMCCFTQVWRAVLPWSCWSLQKRWIRYSLTVLSLWDCTWYTLSPSSTIHSQLVLSITSTNLSALSSDVTQTHVHECPEFWILGRCAFLSLRFLHMSVHSAASAAESHWVLLLWTQLTGTSSLPHWTHHCVPSASAWVRDGCQAQNASDRWCTKPSHWPDQNSLRALL